MTESVEDPRGRAEKLEHVVDDLSEKVADEREAAGAPGTLSDLLAEVVDHVFQLFGATPRVFYGFRHNRCPRRI